MIKPFLAILGSVWLSSCAMSNAVVMTGTPTDTWTPAFVLLDTSVSAPIEHLKDDFGQDPAIARAELAKSLANQLSAHFPKAKVLSAGPELFDSTMSYKDTKFTWNLPRPKFATLQQACGRSGFVLIFSENVFETGFRPMGTFERFWYFDSKHHIQRQQKSLEARGIAGFINMQTGKVEWVQRSSGYADYSLALASSDWLRAFDRRIEALGESAGSNSGSGRGQSYDD
jgi:hypothetical protein